MIIIFYGFSQSNQLRGEAFVLLLLHWFITTSIIIIISVAISITNSIHRIKNHKLLTIFGHKKKKKKILPVVSIYNWIVTVFVA